MNRIWLILMALTAAGVSAPALIQDGDDSAVFTLFVTGADQGVLEPCGCSGGQLGGISQRATLLESLTYGDLPALILSTGGLPGGKAPLYVIRYEISLLCLTEMNYHAAALGPEELAIGLDRLRSAKELAPFPFVLTNVDFPGEEDLPFVSQHIEEVAGFNVALFGIIPESLRESLPEGAVYSSPGEALEAAGEGGVDADLYVVLLRGSRQEAKALEAHLPDPKLILYSEPHSEWEIYDFGQREGVIRYLSPGDRGRFLLSCRMAFGDMGDLEPLEPTVEPIDPETPESDSIEIYLGWYRTQVIEDRILESMVEQKAPPGGAPYIGQESCILCHKAAYKTWAESGHAHAWDTLVDPKVKREFDPECISCHVIGFGYQSAFRSAAETPHLLDVGCESCHGPCAEHVKSAGRVPTPLKVDCMTCHNMEHSTGFHEEEYWEKITCTPDPEPDYPLGKK